MVRAFSYMLIGHLYKFFCDCNFLKLIFPLSLINTIAIVELIQIGIGHMNQISCSSFSEENPRHAARKRSLRRSEVICVHLFIPASHCLDFC